MKWGITFGEAYHLEEHTARKVEYTSKEELIAAIFEKYPPKILEDKQESDEDKEVAPKKLRPINAHSLRSD